MAVKSLYGHDAGEWWMAARLPLWPPDEEIFMSTNPCQHGVTAAADGHARAARPPGRSF